MTPLRGRKNWCLCTYPLAVIDEQVLKYIHSIEDDTGPKFMYEKHRDDLNDVNWYGGEWLEWMEKRTSTSKDLRPVKNSRDYFLAVGPSGEMKLPSPDTHGTGSNWASPIAQLIQIAWGKASSTRYIAPIECIDSAGTSQVVQMGLKNSWYQSIRHLQPTLRSISM